MNSEQKVLNGGITLILREYEVLVDSQRKQYSDNLNSGI